MLDSLACSLRSNARFARVLASSMRAQGAFDRSEHANETSMRAQRAAESLDDALGHTWKNSTKNESWPNADTSLRTETTDVDSKQAHQMPDQLSLY